MECACCGEQIADSQHDVPVNNRYGNRVIGIVRCNHCGAITGQCYRGEFYGIIDMHWDTDPEPETNYFDIVTIGNRVERIHGWYNVKTGKVTQIG